MLGKYEVSIEHKIGLTDENLELKSGYMMPVDVGADG